MGGRRNAEVIRQWLRKAQTGQTTENKKQLTLLAENKGREKYPEVKIQITALAAEVLKLSRVSYILCNLPQCKLHFQNDQVVIHLGEVFLLISLNFSFYKTHITCYYCFAFLK